MQQEEKARQILEEFLSFQKKEIYTLNQLLDKDYLNGSDIERLNKSLYERRKYQAIFRNIRFYGSHKELIKKILHQEEENKKYFLLLQQKIKKNLERLTHKRKAFKEYAKTS